MNTAKPSKRHIAHYRLRRCPSTGWLNEAAADRPDDITHFIYDFDNDILATDKPRARYTSLITLLRRPKVLFGIPRPGKLKWWPSITRVFSGRLNVGQDVIADSFLLERLGKNGWDARGTLHVDADATAYVAGSEANDHAEVFNSLSAALAKALTHEKNAVREFLWGLGERLVISLALTLVVSSTALLFPLAVAFAPDILPKATDGGVFLFTTVAATFVIIAAACFFFRLRTHSQRFYGAIELGVGVGMAVASIRSAYLGARFDFALKVMASVYVMIRGMVNIHEDMISRRAKDRAFLSGIAVSRHSEILDQLRTTKEPRNSGDA